MQREKKNNTRLNNQKGVGWCRPCQNVGIEAKHKVH